MRLIINGESCDLQVSAGLSLQQLLQQLGYLHPSPHGSALRYALHAVFWGGEFYCCREPADRQCSAVCHYRS